jgi:hypothetical protein
MRKSRREMRNLNHWLHEACNRHAARDLARGRPLNPGEWMNISPKDLPGERRLFPAPLAVALEMPSLSVPDWRARASLRSWLTLALRSASAVARRSPSTKGCGSAASCTGACGR